MLYAQLYGAHNLRCLYLLVGNLAAFANPAMTNLALLVRLVVGRAQRTIAQLGVRTKAYTTSMCYNKYHTILYIDRVYSRLVMSYPHGRWWRLQVHKVYYY